MKWNDKGILCGKCNTWVHIKCSKVSVIEYENYQINVEEIFKCKNCKKWGICEKTTASNHRKLNCSICSRYIHLKCNKFDKNDHDYYKKNNKLIFFCINCLGENLPLQNLKDNELMLTLAGINFNEEINVDALHLQSSQQTIVNKLNKVVHDYCHDVSTDEDDSEEVSPIQCKYYSIEEFKSEKLNCSKNFSILHLNIHSVEAHIDELRIVLQLIEFEFDFICLTESKIKKDCEPKIDIKIPNYQDPIGTPTEASKGGVLIYAKEGISIEPREDLLIYKEKELESCFVEVRNEKHKNSIIGVVYRHPCMDQSIFLENYFQPLNDILQTENKNLFITGDFNFDLLNLEHTETSQFFESMMSSQLMPSILLPTKINVKNDTIIDNIFTNQINPEMISGNFSLTISDHLPSFFIMPKDNQNHIPKKHNMYTRDLRNFDRVNFTLDYLNIDWNDKLDRYKNDANKAFEFFYWKMNKLLDKYMPLKKLSKKEYKRKFKPWINGNILNMIKEKNKRFKRFANCKNEAQKTLLKNEYKVVKN